MRLSLPCKISLMLLNSNGKNKILANANCWMKIQPREYSKLALSDQMIRACLPAFELAFHGGYSIDSDNDVNIRTVPPLCLATEPPPQYTAEMAAIMLYKEMEPYLTQVAKRALKLQELIQQLEQQVQVLVIAQPLLLTMAFEEAMRSRGISPVANLNNLQLAAQQSCISKLRSLAS